MQPKWRPEEIRSRELTLTVESASTAEIRLRLTGSVSLKRETGKFPYGYDARLLGKLVYDRGPKAITRFDVLAVGDWTWDYRPGKPKDILGVALELTSRPFSSPPYDRHFPGYNMSNYGYRQDRE